VQPLYGLCSCGCWRLRWFRRGQAIHGRNRCSLGRSLGVRLKVIGYQEAQQKAEYKQRPTSASSLPAPLVSRVPPRSVPHGTLVRSPRSSGHGKCEL